MPEAYKGGVGAIGGGRDGKNRPKLRFEKRVTLQVLTNWINQQNYDEYTKKELIKKASAYPYNSFKNFADNINTHVIKIRQEKERLRNERDERERMSVQMPAEAGMDEGSNAPELPRSECIRSTVELPRNECGPTPPELPRSECIEGSVELSLPRSECIEGSVELSLSGSISGSTPPDLPRSESIEGSVELSLSGSESISGADWVPDIESSSVSTARVPGGDDFKEEEKESDGESPTSPLPS